jgi:hypothetical protein
MKTCALLQNEMAGDDRWRRAYTRTNGAGGDIRVRWSGTVNQFRSAKAFLSAKAGRGEGGSRAAAVSVVRLHFACHSAGDALVGGTASRSASRFRQPGKTTLRFDPDEWSRRSLYVDHPNYERSASGLAGRRCDLRSDRREAPRSAPFLRIQRSDSKRLAARDAVPPRRAERDGRGCASRFA